MARRPPAPISDSPAHDRVHFQSSFQLVFVFTTVNSYQKLDSFHGIYTTRGHFSCRPVRPSNHSPHYRPRSALTVCLTPPLRPPRRPVSNLSLSSMIPYGKSHKEGSAVQHHAPPGSWPATPSARFPGSFSSKLSHDRPYFSVRAASESIHSWIEQFSSTMNVLRVSTLLRDPWIWVCLGT